MRYRLMASFRGASYQAGVGPSDEEVTLFAACPPPEELGFRSSSGHWRKRVSVEEIDALWESRPIGRYRGERCMVLDDLGDRLHICYLGQDLYMARRLGFWEVDRGVFEVVVPRQEIDDLTEERGEFELAILDPADGDPHGSWEAAPRNSWDATGGRPRNLIDTGPSWAADPNAPYDPGAWEGRDVNAQDPRDTGTWAAIRDEGFAEPGGPYPRGRGGWRARDTGGWEAPDTGSWDAREVVERAAREAREARGLADTGSWDARDMRDTGSWDARGLADTGSWDARDMRDTGSWDARDIRDTGSWDARDIRDTGSWDARDIRDTGSWDARDMPDTGGWPARDVTDRAARDGRDARDLADTGSWNARDTRDTGSWDARDMPGAAGWPAQSPPGRDTVAPPASGGWAEVMPYDRREAVGWDPQDTVVWDPATEWGQGQVIQPARPQQTPDAAAVWHGSPAPGDAGLWAPAPPVMPMPAPAREGYGWAEPAPSPADVPPAGTPAPDGAMPNGAAANGMTPNGTTLNGIAPNGAAPGSAMPNGAAPDTAGTVEAASDAPADPREAATPNEYAAMVGRSVGKRSARKPRVTTQAIFSQLLDLASIPQSAYAVDDEVDGAMCLIRNKDGFEVFSASDQARHEVRYFEDEEAAYFYLFGILAAEAVRSGHLGPKSPSQRALEPPSLRQQQR